ncbi:hypothetical protein RGQ29_023572 [Quercus rubra]|uniref:GDSL esterase/lipase n=1 Tax=Quercus rubra TaxID=3512 RepID=A0AAN7F5X8_QUERU|nr:hypothetical protein RGQ29_023572 [Quercus rubra]
MAFMNLDRKIIGGIVPAILTVSILVGMCSAQIVPAIFVFGDSLLDAGNNNYILTLSKANYVPNGIDFGMPTGRFTNGRTVADIIGQELGLKDFTPPYLAPTTTGSVVLQGVNYASGAGGILNHTGKLFMLITPEVFVGTMISRFRLQLTRLYNLGTRKIVVSSVGPIGCIPFERDANPAAGDNCVSLANQLAQLFNAELKSLITDLSTNLKESKFVYADSYSILEDILQNYISYGFENANSACCYLAGRFGGLIPCGPHSKICSDRSKHVFWDPYHPSEATNLLTARRLLDGDTNDITPMNIRQLARL